MRMDEIRSHFPYFNSPQNKDSIYFDNAATTQKPQVVIDEIVNYYQNYNSNIHRSINKLANKATGEYERVRDKIRNFMSAKKNSEIIFTSGATESINLVAQSYVKPIIKENDIILVSPMEHHSNLIPWQILAKETGAKLQFIPINNKLLIDPKKLQKLLNKHVKFVSTHHISNVTGSEQNIKQIIQLVKQFNIPIMIDGAQAIAHSKINVQNLDCDFYCFSGHKIFGPTGTGILYGKEGALLNCLPNKFGGGMVSTVNKLQSKWAELPHKLEAGTPNIAGIVGLGSAIDFVKKVGFEKIIKHEKKLIIKFEKLISNIDGVNILGESSRVAPIFTFNIDGIHHYDLASILAEYNIHTRSGHLCSQSLMNYCGIPGATRISLSIYNTEEEIERFILILRKIIAFLKK